MPYVQTAEKHCHEMSPKCVKEKRKQLKITQVRIIDPLLLLSVPEPRQDLPFW